DVAAAIHFCVQAGLPRLWLVGWSFGTELALMWGNVPQIEGAFLLSPAVRPATDSDLGRWAAAGRGLTALVPEPGDELRPEGGEGGGGAGGGGQGGGEGKTVGGGGDLCPSRPKRDRAARNPGRVAAPCAVLARGGRPPWPPGLGRPRREPI